MNNSLNERGMFIGDPLIDDLKSKQLSKVHDLVLLEAGLENVESEIAALLSQKLKLVDNIRRIKAEKQIIDESMVRVQQSVLVKWRNLANRFGLQYECNPTDNNFIIPSVISLLPMEVIINIFEYLSFHDIYFNVSRVLEHVGHASSQRIETTQGDSVFVLVESNTTTVATTSDSAKHHTGAADTSENTVRRPHRHSEDTAFRYPTAVRLQSVLFEPTPTTTTTTTTIARSTATARAVTRARISRRSYPTIAIATASYTTS
ncbi:hypothetical protein PPL_01412 [Heterostelium album PN500]|uniref:F-box domain-containing protein n=1 Tax=Heterostelium pallidum (strain ATCC 26659 / Pp 5 / PN500) TaxID=670386 RepID=D3AZ72_HETP5|nr:hypothetical protein PPL_01412 [Heterostelium album PN500]EFA85455.1 hypothetical protein PPL_01412 [Heterostelium album PN500]|eukprot:XP_020437564.1 hypothetical protein PPL_01412 [Heterostelium album PN500]